MTKYKETKKAFKDGTITGIRTERYVKSNNKDNDDELSEDKPKLSKIESETVAAAGPPDSVERRVKSSTLRSPEEEHEDSQE